MMSFSRLRRHLLGTSALAMLMASSPASAQGLAVFDPLNYQQNLVSSVRALEQINNQVRQLQSQALMIVRMDQNLQRLGTSLAPDLQQTLAQIQARLHDGNGLALTMQGTEAAYARLFPRELSAALTADEMLTAAKARWNEEHASLQRAALLQAQIADTNGTDARLLDQALSRSRSAAGALEATQAGNEVGALSVKQSLQLQTLIAAQSRAETLGRARDLAIENESRQRFKTFLGSGPAYAAAR